MWMRSKDMRERVCLFMAVLFFSAGTVWAQVPVSEAIRQQSVMEYGKKVLGEGQAAAVSGQMTPYERDTRELVSQLQVVSDNEDVNYTIVSGDTLTIAFSDRGQMVRAAYKVSQSGEVFLPLAGNIKVAGLNRRQARERVEAMLKEYIREPRVGMVINTDGRVMIFGAVGSPGIFNMTNKMSVMEAILSAGGFNKDKAEMTNVIIIRGPVEKPVILKLNLKKMITKGDRTDDIAVKPGDFIYLPTTVISSLERFWDVASGFLMRWYGLGGSQPIQGKSWDWGGF
jgi:protein involved in polysaccharide export with SLBB domain